MEARELRIGNWIEYNGNYVKWGKSDFCEPNASIIANPLPLTNRWLLDFGFQQTDKKDAHFISVGEYELHIVCNPFSGTLSKEPSWFCSVKIGYGSQPMTLVKMYVHELQNLFYALTGEELEIKEQ